MSDNREKLVDLVGLAQRLHRRCIESETQAAFLYENLLKLLQEVENERINHVKNTSK